VSDDEQTFTEPTAPHVRVVGGGTPSAAELAAVVVALTPVGPPASDPVGGSTAAGGAGAWARAALLEGVGARPVVSAPELDRADHAHPARPRG
jgi:hypothetical protein